MDRIRATSEHSETEEIREKAKIAVLLIVQKFAKEDIFENEECENFVKNYLEELRDGYLFKIKKFLLPALISASKHLSYESVLKFVWKEFSLLLKDDVWGVRKVCIENAADMIEHLKPDEVGKFKEVFEFFKRCLLDPNRWVKT
jgi:hypothetical protein